MTESLNCPFCGNIIEKDALKCPACGALFKEPDLPGFKFREFRIFFALDFVTWGFFATLWFFINYGAINGLSSTSKDSLKFNWLILLLIINVLAYIFFGWPMILLTLILYIALTYRVLRIIQKYTEREYSVSIDFNPYYVTVFSVLYLVHFIDTYTDRVLNNHDYFDFKSPQGVVLIILLVIMAITVYHFHDVLIRTLNFGLF